jgi:hypothetical protein
MLRFSDLNPLGRAIIVAVAVLTFGVAAVAFLTSYGALYAFVRDTGLYSEQLTRLYPLLLDAAFIVAELAAIFFGIVRGPRGWPWFTMLLSGGLSVWFNIAHAAHGWDRRLIAALPPILMMLAFQIDVAVVRSVMRALGRPLEQAPLAAHLGTLQAQRSWWNASEASEATGQIGQEWGSGGEAPTKGSQVDAYLDAIGPEGARELKARGITAALQNRGVDVSERYVRQRLEARTGAPSRNGHGEP